MSSEELRVGLLMDKVCVEIKRKKEYDLLMMELEMRGFMWCGNKLPTDQEFNHWYKGKDFIFIDLNDRKYLTHSDKKYSLSRENSDYLKMSFENGLNYVRGLK
jgi:hypothetical protein